ncbi:MAG: hypothetical protein ACK52R_02280 [Betaproteobacteria bacterium]
MCHIRLACGWPGFGEGTAIDPRRSHGGALQVAGQPRTVKVEKAQGKLKGSAQAPRAAGEPGKTA